MQICVHFDSARLYRWHLALLTALSDAGHDAVVSFVDTPEPLPTSLTVVFDYDRARRRAADDRFSTHLLPKSLAGWPRYGGGGYDLMLDLSSASRVQTHPGRVLRPLYDGSYKDYALFHCVLTQRAPRLELADSQSRGHVWLIGRPAIEAPWRPSLSFEMITSRLIEGIVRMLPEVAGGKLPAVERSEQTNFAGRSSTLAAALKFAALRLRRKATRAAGILTANKPKWHVAWRRPRDANMPSTAQLTIGDFRTLEDGGNRYFADPFLFAHADTTHVFVEEVPSLTGRGVISHFTLQADGTPSKPQCVLDTGSHLSYPFVFEHEGTIYLLPEATAAGGLDLYRAGTFPTQWEKVARLIDQPIHDATLFRHEDRWWIAAGNQILQSSSWDGLSLFFAQSLLGPWQPHPLNPVLIDASAARPAGPLWRDTTGHWIRPAQDCSTGYGGAITLRRILQLDPQHFREETAGTINFGAKNGLQGPHTIARTGGFEIVDLYASPGRLRAGYRG